MGAIAELVRPELAIAMVASYLFLRIAPQAARMFAGRKTLEIERHKETTITEVTGELNDSRLGLNDTKAAAYFALEDELTKRQLDNEKLKNQQEPLEEGVKTATEAIGTLDAVIDHVDSDTSTALSHDGSAIIKIEVPEQAKSESDSVSESGLAKDTATRRHLGLPPTTADKLLTSEPSPRNSPPTRQQSGPKDGKDNGRAR